MTEVAPALSTAQTEDTFAFDKFSTAKKERSYLNKSDNTDLYEAINNYYNIDKLVDALNDSSYEIITLQFPDTLIQDSSIVMKILQSKISLREKRFYVLGDTAYSPCCVDEVAAEHVGSQLVVHFGDSCLNSISKLPVFYSFGNPSMNIDGIVEKFKETYKTEDKVCIMGDTPHTSFLSEIFMELQKNDYKDIIYTNINTGALLEKDTIIDCTSYPKNHYNNGVLDKRIFLSESEDLTVDPHDYALFYLTTPSNPYLLYLTTQFSSITLIDPPTLETSTGPFPSIMKRYKQMHIARTAGTIGILINTLSLANTNESVNKLVSMIKAQGKKHYLFVVGKPNVPKLANFDPIDIWCIVGCNMGGMILDQYNEFYKPMITPYELVLAFEREVTWTGQWTLDFNKALEDIELEIQEDKEKEEKFSDEPEFDVVTGKFVDSSRPLRRMEHVSISIEGDNNKQLVKNVAGGVIVKGTVSTSANTLANRSWKGLGHGTSDFEDEVDEDGAELEDGISGVARGYNMDKDKL